jgi:hypothetical protein
MFLPGKFFFAVLFISTSISLNAQDTAHYFLDSTASALTSKEKSFFHFVLYPDEGGWCIEKRVSSDQSLVEKIHYKDKTLAVMNGRYTYYSGNIIYETGYYIDGHKDGTWLKFNDKGELLDSILFSNGEMKESYLFLSGTIAESVRHEKDGIHTALYYSSGKIDREVINRSDTDATEIIEYGLNGKPTAKMFRKNTPVEPVVSNGTDHGKRSGNIRLPEFPTGKTGLQRFIDNEIKIPSRLRYRYLYPCSFACSILINSKGDVDEIRVVKSVNLDFDNTIKSALKRMPRWSMHGAPEYTFNLMITFADDRTEDDKPFDVMPYNGQRRN